ncbi:hypothetical protein ASD12_18060 [Mesorhizobium sp. Root102]|uniref:hypothetical protein n=1 Tax=Mesorhizobium sp. Root102 TaxID=1736422 RepID=UPI0006FC138A|nr:hypothetical protein [Mesorhizobium sp. Root102]KQU77705.1 hypothetical protein ASD12_18060 [Mesorhizobium sp. Root102]
MSIWQIHYDALYASPIAVDAVLTVACGNPPETIRAIDKTVGQMIAFNRVDVATIGPAATVRASELAAKGIEPKDVDNGTLAMNGKDWKIINHEPLPAPTGEAGGELRLMLEEIRG